MSCPYIPIELTQLALSAFGSPFDCAREPQFLIFNDVGFFARREKLHLKKIGTYPAAVRPEHSRRAGKNVAL
jgi:hypothetical protein